MRYIEESNLVTHARQELELIEEEPDTIAGYLKIISAFAEMGHSGGSASVAVPVLGELLCYRNLAPLTDDQGEWLQVGEECRNGVVHHGIWQNRRRSDAFSYDGGKTYYLLDERKSWYRRRRPKFHKSESRS